METAIDLIRCVGNDVVEASSSSESSLSTVSAHDLGKIIEEELDGGKRDEKIFLVQTKAASAAATGTKKKRRGKRRRAANGNVWESRKTFTIRVEEMHQVRDEVDDEDKYRGVAEWRKNRLESPVVWKFGKDEGEEQRRGRQDLEEKGGEEVEDIFRDWLRMQRRGSGGVGAAEDVNDIFWKIGMSDSGRTRQRRISEVLDNLPFDDQPDIFGDRCELLETAPSRAGAIDVKPPLARAARRVKEGQRRLRRQKSYWNIFSEWKKIFNESHGRRQKRKRNFKHRRRSKRPKKVDQKDQSRLVVGCNNNSGFKWCKSPRKRSIVTMENYFRDFLHVFDEDEGETRTRCRRRSRDMVDDDSDEVFEENIPKRQRVDPGNRYPYRRNWEVIRLESSRTFEMITRNIELKIREAFREEAESSSSRGAADLEFGRIKLQESRQEFDSLRRRVQDVRQGRRRRSLEGLDEAAFDEWRWNLQEPQTGIEMSAILKPPNRATFRGTAIREVAQRYHFKGSTASRQNATCLQRRPNAKVGENARCNRKARFIHNFPMNQPRGRKGDFGARKRA